MPRKKKETLAREEHRLLHAYNDAWHLKKAAGWPEQGDIAVDYLQKRKSYLDFISKHPEFS